MDSIADNSEKEEITKSVIDDIGQWIQASYRKTKRTAKNLSAHSSPEAKKKVRVDHKDTPRRNRFIILSDDSDDDESSKSNKHEDKPEDKETNKIRKKTFCPPIFVKGVSIKECMKIVDSCKTKANLGDANAQFCATGPMKAKIYVDDFRLHELCIKIFQELSLKCEGIEAFSFPPKELTTKSIILRGIGGDFTADEIEAEIKSIFENISFIKVSRFSTPHSRREDLQLPLFSVRVNCNEDIKTLTSLRTLLHCRVRWEKPRLSSPKRCYKCQRSGHIAKFCAFKARSVICSLEHPIGVCPVKAANSETNSKTGIKCANCGSSEHVASYGGCPYRQRLLKKKRESVLQTNSRHVLAQQAALNAAATSLRMPQRSYADVARLRFAPTNVVAPSNMTNTTSVFADFFQESINLFGISFSELLPKIRNFWTDYKELPDQNKPMAYISFLASLSP